MTESGLTVTEKALSTIKKFKGDDAELSEAALRIMVTGSGCSGMDYRMGFDSQPAAVNDRVIDKDGVKFIVDAKSYLSLAGTILDYSDDTDSSGFIFSNPHAKHSCNCGKDS